MDSKGLLTIGVILVAIFGLYVLTVPSTDSSSLSGPTATASVAATAAPSTLATENLLPSVEESQRYSTFILAGSPVTVLEQRSPDSRNVRFIASGDGASDSDIIVFIPKSEAASASEIQVDGTYDVIQDDPVFFVKDGAVLKFKNPVQQAAFATLILPRGLTDEIQKDSQARKKWLDFIRLVSSLSTDDARALMPTVAEYLSDPQPIFFRVSNAHAIINNFLNSQSRINPSSADGLPSVPNPVLITSNLAPFGTAFLGPVDEDLGQVLNIGSSKSSARKLLTGKLIEGLDVNDYATLRHTDGVLFLDVDFVPYLQAASEDADRAARLIQFENLGTEGLTVNLYYSGKPDTPVTMPPEFHFYSVNPQFDYTLLDAQKAAVATFEGLSLPAQQRVFSCEDVSDFLQSAAQELVFESQADLARVDYAAEFAKSKSYTPSFVAYVELQFNPTGKAETCHVAGDYIKADVQFQPDSIQAFTLTYAGANTVQLLAGLSASDVETLLPPGTETGVPELSASAVSSPTPASS